MVEQACPCLAERWFGHPAKLAALDFADAALVGGIIGPDRDDPAFRHFDTQRLFGVGGEYVEDMAAKRHLARLIHAFVGDIAQVEQHRVKLAQIARVIDRDAGRLGSIGFGRRKGASERFALGDEGDTTPILCRQCHLGTVQRRYALPDIGG